MTSTVILVWLLLAVSPGKVPIAVVFESQQGCEANLADTIKEGKKQGIEINGACQKVRLVQSIQGGGV
jgi:hypothetical protein